MINHPITPPPELVQQWWTEFERADFDDDSLVFVATQAARWGADQELGACRLWVSENCDIYSAVELIRFRRPKPPSLKEQALAVLDHTQKGYGLAEVDLDTIRRALEALPE